MCQLGTLLIQHAQGRDDLSDTKLLCEASVFQLARINLRHKRQFFYWAHCEVRLVGLC